MTFRFPIGTQYTSRGSAQTYTVTDQLTTTNSAGEVVRERYVTTHRYLGQVVVETDVCDTTIARGLLPKYAHLLNNT